MRLTSNEKIVLTSFLSRSTHALQKAVRTYVSSKTINGDTMYGVTIKVSVKLDEVNDLLQAAEKMGAEPPDFAIYVPRAPITDKEA